MGEEGEVAGRLREFARVRGQVDDLPQSVGRSDGLHRPRALDGLTTRTGTAGHQVMLVKRENSEKSRDKALKKGSSEAEARGCEAPVGCRVQLGERDLEMPLQEFEQTGENR